MIKHIIQWWVWQKLCDDSILIKLDVLFGGTTPTFELVKALWDEV